MTDSQVEKEIDRVEQELIDAARRQDAAALDRIGADDFLITSDTMETNSEIKSYTLRNVWPLEPSRGGLPATTR